MESFYPFLDVTDSNTDIAQPSTPARIAVYDTMTIAPRVVSIEPSDIKTYLEEITQSVYTLASQQGTDWPFTLIRELVENYIHASFIEPTISILDKGQTLVFSDSGPGIAHKEDAIKPSFTSATKEMKKYIRGVGSGLPIVEGQMKLQHGSLKIEDNIGQGTVITVSVKQNPLQAQNNNLQTDTQIHQPQQTSVQPLQQTTHQQYSPDVLYRYDPQQGFIPVAPQLQTFGNYLPQQLLQQSLPTNTKTTPQNTTITAEQKNILKYFSQYDAIGPKELTAYLGMSPASCSRKLKDLAQMNYIMKSGQKYVLTQDGRLLLNIILNES